MDLEGEAVVEELQLLQVYQLHQMLILMMRKIMEKEILQYLVVVSEQRLEVDNGH